MNPVFVFMVILAAVLLWFLCVFVFKPLGGLLLKLWNDAFEVMNEKDKKEEKSKDE